MTPSIEGREAGRELDAEIAERVMGWTSVTLQPMLSMVRDVTSGRDHLVTDGAELRGFCPDLSSEDFVPLYSTTIGSAFLVVEAMRAKGYGVSINALDAGGWKVCFIAPGYEGHDADTLPLAVCLAAIATLTPEKAAVSETPISPASL